MQIFVGSSGSDQAGWFFKVVKIYAVVNNVIVGRDVETTIVFVIIKV